MRVVMYLAEYQITRSAKTRATSEEDAAAVYSALAR